MTKSVPSRDNLIAAIRDVAKSLDKNEVSNSEFVKNTGIARHHVLRYFDSWNEFVLAAGLKPIDKSRIEDDRLFASMRDAFIQAGGIVTQIKFRKFSEFSIDVYRKHIGEWRVVLFRFKDWVEKNDPSFPYTSELPGPGFTLNNKTKKSALIPHSFKDSKEQVSWSALGGNKYGEFLNFRGLQHAPINEQGVVFLFGMVAKELGYIVESIAVGFPDCEAKRCVNRKKSLWERVLIEFEFQSRNFTEHGHDQNQCDVIVCWENNWKNCPLEVLELKSEIKKLKANA
jgi:hypothetical protein